MLVGSNRAVFTCAKIYGGDTYLKNHLSANDYYAEGEKVSGQWVGKGVELLGLEGKVEAEPFEALRNNLRPGTEDRLTPRTKETRTPTMREAAEAFRRRHQREGSSTEVANYRLSMKPLPNRVALFDFQCSAQKSVSIMAVLAGDERLREAHEKAARRGFAELEQFASRRKNTLFRQDSEVTGNLCAAAFTHDASRALDPQLHTHFVVANATCASSRRWYALNERFMFKAIRYAGKVYQNELAREVKALGYDIREVRNPKGQVTGFEIEGVSDELCQRFAKRRAEIEREMTAFTSRHGREPTTAEIASITRQTRDVKLAEITTPQVHAKQRSELSAAEWEHLQAVKARALSNAGARGRTWGQEVDGLQASVDHLFERQSVAPAHAILSEALNQHLGAIDLETLKQALADGTGEIVRLEPEQALLTECTTKHGLELERWSVAFVDATKERCLPLNPTFEPDGALSHEQRTTVRAILATRDQVFSLRGIAGAGKTTTLKEVQRGLAGRVVYYVAPTASAAKVLQGEGFRNATTVEDFLQNVSRREALHHAVVICDEAGLKSNRQGAQLLHLAQRNNLRVLFVGDVRQHVSVEAGDFLRVLEAHSRLGRCEIAEIRRQQNTPYKNAIMRMAAGDAKGGLAALDQLGWIKEGRADYLESAADDYLRLTDGGRALDRCLMVAPTWQENHRLSDSIRLKLQQRGLLRGQPTAFSVHDSLGWTQQQKRNVQNYAPGQIVTFTLGCGPWQAGESVQVVGAEAVVVSVTAFDGSRHHLDLRQAGKFDVGRARRIEVLPGDKLLIRANDKRHGLIDGHVLTLDRIEPDGTIATREGLRIPRGFNQWGHGYVVTSHKAQGRTCEHVVVAAERLDAKAAYVACSRGKLSCTVHTPDKERLQERLPEGSRQAALDVLAHAAPATVGTPLAAVVARAPAWMRLLPSVTVRKAREAKAQLRRKLEQIRQRVRLWERFRSQWRRIALKREQSAARLRAN